ncbi:MAG: DUF3159 domain-containing protein [Pseudonocardiaceae bacterium]
MNRGRPAVNPTSLVTDEGWRSTAKAILRRSGGVSGMVIAAAPTIVFVVVNSVSSLVPALIATVISAIVAFGWRLIRREPLREPMVGLIIAAVCIVVAVYTGEAKGFFLLPILMCAVGVVVCIASVLAHWPLAGLLMNRIVGGRRDWREQRRLRRVYSGMTLLSAAVSGVNFILQAALYRANQTAWLGALHTVTGPLWAAITIITVVLARRAIKRDTESVPT